MNDKNSHKKIGLNRRRASITVPSTGWEHYGVWGSVWLLKVGGLAALTWNLETLLAQLVPPHDNYFIAACWLVSLLISCIPYWMVKHFEFRLSSFYSTWDRIRSNAKIMGEYAHSGGSDKEQEDTNELLHTALDYVALASGIYILAMTCVAVVRVFPTSFFFSAGGAEGVLTRSIVFFLLDVLGVVWSLVGEVIANTFYQHRRIDHTTHTMIDRHYNSSIEEVPRSGLPALPPGRNNTTTNNKKEEKPF